MTEDQFQIILTRLKAQDENLEKRFAEQDKKFDARFAEQDKKFDARFAKQDARFAEQDKKFDARFAKQDARFAEQDARFAEQDKKFDARFAKQDARFAEQDEKFERIFDALADLRMNCASKTDLEELRGEFREFKDKSLSNQDKIVSRLERLELEYTAQNAWNQRMGKDVEKLNVAVFG